MSDTKRPRRLRRPIYDGDPAAIAYNQVIMAIQYELWYTVFWVKKNPDTTRDDFAYHLRERGWGQRDREGKWVGGAS